MKLATALSFLLLHASGALGENHLRQREEANMEETNFDEMFSNENDLDEDVHGNRELGYWHKYYLNIKATNLMQAQVLSRFFYMTHKCDAPNLFEFGEMSSPELAILAEDGNPVPLFEKYKDSPYVCDAGYNSGGTPPGETSAFQLKVGHCRCFTIASMLVGTNDSFSAVNGASIRHKDINTYPAFDAGSEGNSELCEHIPGPPCDNGTGNTNAGNPEGYVHVNRGISGDFDVGFTYDWRNPVMSVSSYVTRSH